jgi:hypothetical protein
MEYAVIILQTLTLLIIGWFVKNYFPSYLSKKGENLATKEDIGGITAEVEKARLLYASELERTKKDLQGELENLRHQLALIAQERQVRFAKLHEKRIETISEVYYSLVKIVEDGERLQVAILLAKKEEREGKYERLKLLAEDVGSACEQFLDRYTKYKLYFSKSLEEKVEEIISPLKRVVFIYKWKIISASFSTSGEHDGEEVKLLGEVQVDSKTVTAALKAIEEELRALIGSDE